MPAKIRILHVINNRKNVYVRLNGKRIIPELGYLQVSDYVSLPQGEHTIAIYEHDKITEKLYSKKLAVGHEKSYLLILIGKEGQKQIYCTENKPDVPLGESKMRLLHLSSNAPSLDLAVKNRDVVFPNVSYQHVTEYLGLTPMSVDLELRLADSKHVVMPLPKMKYKPNEAYTHIIIDYGGNSFTLFTLKE